MIAVAVASDALIAKMNENQGEARKARRSAAHQDERCAMADDHRVDGNAGVLHHRHVFTATEVGCTHRADGTRVSSRGR